MLTLLYIDAGSGSIIIQSLIGLAAGAAFFVKVNWYRLKAWMSRNKDENKDADTENP